MFRLEVSFADNEDFRHAFRWVDRKGTPISLSGFTLLMHVKKQPSDPIPVLVLSSANGRATIDPVESHRFTLAIERGALKAGNYQFDLLRVAPDGERYRMAQGLIRVDQGVTA